VLLGGRVFGRVGAWLELGDVAVAADRVGDALVRTVEGAVDDGAALRLGDEPHALSSTPATTVVTTRRRMPVTLAHDSCKGGTATLKAPDVRSTSVTSQGGQPNLQELMKQAQKMQEQLMAAQAELADTEVSGTAGGGLVTATMLGSGELTSLTIDPKVVDPDDIETLQDLIVAAVRDASRSVGEIAADAMGPLTGGAGLGGLGLPGL